MSATDDPLLQVESVDKSYASPVLRKVNFDLRCGEVHALVGANGAGKSTLARILSGLAQPDRGQMTVAGVTYAPRDKASAERQGIQLVHQELNLLGTLSVAENLFLSHLDARFGFVLRRRLNARARRALSAVGLEDVEPQAAASSLGVGQQQLVEIAKALAQSCRVLILDEPTAALTGPEIDTLFGQIARLKAAGSGVIYISHRMEEIQRVADRVTVLRDGRVVATRQADECSHDDMVSLIVGRRSRPGRHGRTHAARPSPRRAGQPGHLALAVKNLQRGKWVRDVCFEVHQGEIFGVAGLVGSGRTELLRTIFGADQADAGEVRVGGARPRLFDSPRQAVQAGLAMVPEDRKLDGLLLPQSIRINTTVNTLPRVARFRSWIDWRRESQAVEECTNEVQLQSNSFQQKAEHLSGGNQQKLLIGRWLLHDAEVFLLDEPTRGIDVAARETVYQLIDGLVERGKAVVVVSSDLQELMAISDRIGVMSAGRMVEVFDRESWSEHALTSAAFRGYGQDHVGQ